MLLEKINFNSSQDYLHMERYVNAGSPSGFDEIHTTSLPTKAKGRNVSFHLIGVSFPNNVSVQEFGIKPQFADNWQMLVHPDMIYNIVNNELFSAYSSINLNALLVAPTASSRTVKILDDSGWFVKLNYRGLIGRVDRTIGKDQALSAIEVSDIIVRAIDSGQLPRTFFFMREPFSRVVELKEGETTYQWGMVFREPLQYPNRLEVKYLIPAFSFFSEDEKSKGDPTILTQLITRQTKSVEDFLFEDIISPIYEGYFQLLLKCGLQLECHAQNTLFAIDENFKILGFVAKDAESIDKDISLMEERGITHNIQTTIYKCRYRTSKKYHIMHSFFFDNKLGVYLIKPIIENAALIFPFDKKKLIQRIKEFNQGFIKQLPTDFFPTDGKWYTNERKVHDRSGNVEQQYLGFENPEFRY